MAKRIYFGVIERASDGYCLYFPDLLGCTTAADDMEGLALMAAEALQFHIDGMAEDGDLIPAPTEVDLTCERQDVPQANLIGLLAVEAVVPTFPNTVAVPLDTKLVQEVDRLASDRRQFIADAIRQRLDDGHERAA